MNFKLLVIATFIPVVNALPASAAVSGFYDSAEQINAIIESPDVANQLRQAPIRHLANTGTRDDGVPLNGKSAHKSAI